MSHQAAGKMPAATRQLGRVPDEELGHPSATAVGHGMPVVTFSQGTPMA